MNTRKNIALAGLCTLLASCGGGGSSSNGGGDTITYTGSQRLIVYYQGQSQTTSPSGFLMHISGNNVTIDDPDFKAHGKMSGNQFSATSPVFSFASGGLACTNTKVTYAGTRNSNRNQVTGKISGRMRCNGLPFTLGGSFTASSGQGKQLHMTLSQALTETVR